MRLVASLTSRSIALRTGAPMTGRKIFLACPIGDEGSETRKLSDTVLVHLLQEAIKRDHSLSDVEIIRADMWARPGKITAQIMELVLSADVLVADLTNLNPNVMYELGLRQASRLSTVLIARKGTNLPFDLMQYRTVFYETSLDEMAAARDEVALHLQAALSGEREYSEDVMFSPLADAHASSSDNRRDASLLKLLDSMAEADNRTAKSLEQTATSVEQLSDRVDTVVRDIKRIFTSGYRGAGTYLYIDGEDEAFSALTAALLRAKESIRTTRFSPFAVGSSQPDFARAIRRRVLGDARTAPVKNFYRIVAANDMSKLDDIRNYLDDFVGRRFTLFLTPHSNNFELVIIDNSEVFIHFHDRERVIASTLQIMSKEVSKRFLEIYSSLNDPALHADVRKYDFKYLTMRDSDRVYAEVEEYFSRHMTDQAADEA